MQVTSGFITRSHLDLSQVCTDIFLPQCHSWCHGSSLPCPGMPHSRAVQHIPLNQLQTTFQTQLVWKCQTPCSDSAKLPVPPASEEGTSATRSFPRPRFPGLSYLNTVLWQESQPTTLTMRTNSVFPVPKQSGWCLINGKVLGMAGIAELTNLSQILVKRGWREGKTHSFPSGGFYRYLSLF